MPDQTPSIEEQAARMIVDDLDPLTKKVREISGTPYGVANLTPEQELWAFQHLDTTVNPDALRAAGMSDAEIADHLYPLRPRLRGQAGLTYAEQEAWTDRMAERVMAAAQKGRVPNSPDHGPNTLEGASLVPPHPTPPPIPGAPAPAADQPMPGPGPTPPLPPGGA